MGTTLDPEPLGRMVAETSDEALALRRRPPVAERLARIHAAQERRAARDGSLRQPIAVGVAVGALVAAALLWPRPEPLRVLVGEPAVDHDGGYAPKPPLRADQDGLAWVAAPPGTAVPIGFSDGSRFLLSGGARARVVGVTEHGARVVVERGSVRADVVPRRGNDWSVIGGPFEIHVTGTSFDAGWDPDREELHVAVRHGSVLVRGPCLPAARPLAGGQEATLSCAPPEASRPAPSTPIAPRALASATAGAPAHAPAPAPPPTTASAAAPPPSWRDLARAGAYKEAIAAAEAEGFDHLCDDLPAADLMDLASTARLGGRAALAAEAYTAVRRRFPGTDHAATAAFRLGQLAFDGAHAFADARRWFLTYLAERPGGALETEALGRTMESEQRLGDLPAARATAARYLARHPDGAHAALARSLLAP